jgi:hypothetical protein
MSKIKDEAQGTLIPREVKEAPQGIGEGVRLPVEGSTELVVSTETKAVIPEGGYSETGALMQIAISNGAGIETLERLIALKNQEEDRAAQKEFNYHFAEMQKELVPVLKTKEGNKTTAGEVTFKYAPIEDCQKENDPIIAKHGFSYKWTKEELENGNLRVRIHISGWGWTDSATFHDVPPNPKNSLQSLIQAEAVRTGYGKRYSYVDGFGITVAGEDIHDSLPSIDDIVDHPDIIIQINGCTTIEELDNISSMIYQELKKVGDKNGVEVLKTLKLKKKAELKGDK